MPINALREGGRWEGLHFLGKAGALSIVPKLQKFRKCGRFCERFALQRRLEIRVVASPRGASRERVCDQLSAPRTRHEHPVVEVQLLKQLTAIEVGENARKTDVGPFTERPPNNVPNGASRKGVSAANGGDFAVEGKCEAEVVNAADAG